MLCAQCLVLTGAQHLWLAYLDVGGVPADGGGRHAGVLGQQQVVNQQAAGSCRLLHLNGCWGAVQPLAATAPSQLSVSECADGRPTAIVLCGSLVLDGWTLRWRGVAWRGVWWRGVAWRNRRAVTRDKVFQRYCVTCQMPDVETDDY